MNLASVRVAAAVCILGASACGVQNDSSPREILESERPEQVVANSISAPSPVGGTDRIFLIAPSSAEQPSRLRSVRRDVGDSAALRLRSLFGALSVADISDRLSSAIPDGLTLRSAALRPDGTLVVDVTDELLGLSSSALIDAVAQIVFTASEVIGVERVELLVDAVARRWPASDGELQVQPLTIYDFPGFVESTQPDYPAVPSP